MSNEATQVLRLYDSEFAAKIKALQKKEQKQFKSNNEFLTALLRLGYESYVNENKSEVIGTDVGQCIKEIKDIVTQTAEYEILRFRTLELYQEVFQRLLSASYRMLLALTGGEKVMPQKIEDGFFDDLPARFNKILASLTSKSVNK
ncbi:MAG: hypothetical protein FWC80_00450 [Firmicutes bacterium]|nr:hypothetical protein [Bacillota bacterium]